MRDLLQDSPEAIGNRYFPVDIGGRDFHEKDARLFAEVHRTLAFASLIENRRRQWTSADGAVDDDLEPARPRCAGEPQRFPVDPKRADITLKGIELLGAATRPVLDRLPSDLCRGFGIRRSRRRGAARCGKRENQKTRGQPKLAP